MEAPVPVPGSATNETLFFRGAAIFNASVEHLLTVGLAAAEEVVLKGCSAGGLAVFLHCDFFAGMLRAAGVRARVTCMPDAGFFRDHVTFAGAPLYTPQQQWVFSAMNATQVDAGCLAAHVGADAWKCFFAE